ncbi:MAG: cation transporter [Bacteroidaceae bacterium]|nr:cation transporter [Bacteroidaceae bacterium]
MYKDTRENSIYRVTIAGSIVNFFLTTFKFIAGVVGHSSAMIADAVHSLSDFITDIIVIVFVRISSKPADRSHGYGHGKYETLATAIIGCVLLGVSVGILIEGIKKIIEVFNGGTIEAPGMIALVAAAISIIFKEAVYRYTIYKGKSLHSQAVIANAWHHRSDVFSSIGTLLGIGGAIFLGEKWRILDPVAAIIVSIFIAKVAFDILIRSLEELLEHSLPKDIEDEIIDIILSVEGVTAPHHLRTRRIGNNLAIEVHIRMDGDITLSRAHQMTSVVEWMLKERFGKETHVNIHTEPIK